MRTSTISILVCLLALTITTTIHAADDLMSKCSEDFTKVTSCLSFVTAKAAQPTKECCASVTEIRQDDPACLCFFIQMANNGSVEQVKSMGIKVSQLLLLPSACKLADSNISNCPKLLGLPANSPAAAVFTNLTAPTTPSTTSGGATSTSTSTTSSNDTSASSGMDQFVAFFLAMVAVSMSVIAVSVSA